MLSNTAIAALATLSLFAAGTALAAPIDDFVAKVESLPPWASLDAKKFEEAAAKYRDVGDEFQRFSIEDAAKIVRALAANAKPKEGGSLGAESRLYVLLRFYFAVPQYEDPEKVKRFGGGWGVPEDDKGNVNILWPLATEKDGTLILKYKFKHFFGPPYNPVSEMEYFRDMYGRRAK